MVSKKKRDDDNDHKKMGQLVTIADLEHFKAEIICEINRVVNRGKSLPAKKWMKTIEVIKLLSVSPGKLQTMRKSGALAYTRIGGSLFYDPEDIYKMFEDNKVMDE
jgi:hypothetical protein